MNWLIWRQHRKQWFVFLVLLAVFAAVAIPGGLRFWHEYQHLHAACAPANNCNLTDMRNTIFNTQLDGLVVNGVKLSLLAMPFILGLFWGVPLLAKEYSEKTNKLVWTQGISRKKWLTAKLAWVLGATIVYVTALSAIATWFSKTGNIVNQNRFDVLAFSSQSIVPVAIAVFAVSAGILCGAWFKKIIPALGVTIGLLIVLQIAVPLFARTHYASPQTYNSSSLLSTGRDDPFDPSLPNSPGAWVISEKMINSAGNVFDWANPPQACKIADPAMVKDHPSSERHAVIGRNNVFIDINCLSAQGYRWQIKYQPNSRYWKFQAAEAGLYAALSLVVVAGTYALVTKRDA